MESFTSRKEVYDDGKSNHIAVSIGACPALWGAVFEMYPIAPSGIGTQDGIPKVLEGWQVGTILGMEDVLVIVEKYGMAVEDVVSPSRLNVERELTMSPQSAARWQRRTSS